MVEVFSMATGFALTGSPQRGQLSRSSSNFRLHAEHRIAMFAYRTASRGPFPFSCTDSLKFSRTT